MADKTPDKRDTDDEVTAVAGRGSSDLGSGNLGSMPHGEADRDAERHADAQRTTAAAGTPEDPTGTSPGDAAEVPVPAEDAAEASSESFPPINQAP